MDRRLREEDRTARKDKYKNATPEQLKIMSLEAKIDAGTATSQDLAEFKALTNSQSPEQRLNALKEKIKTGNFNEADAKEYARLTRGEANVEQNLEQLNKQAEDAMMRILRGEGNLEDNILELHRLKELVDKRAPVMSEERAKELVRRVLNPEDSGLLGKQELALQREIRAKIERLLIAEYPQQQDQLQKASEDTKSAIKVKKREVSSGSDEDKLRKRMELYQLYMQLTNVRADRIKLDRAADIMEAEHRDITQYLDRKLGVTNPIMSFVAFADAKVRNAGAYTRAEMDFFTDI
ncbi:MAG: hypothetical protein HYT09_01915 [Candidatus Levybacteria bacterium]|nr:hypothetical protein [Candidatus Levybacteria bacterium]